MKLRTNFNFDPERLRIMEVYRSIQGEGIDVGKEVIFVRMSGCNLSCVWCDTKPSWTGKIGIDCTPGELINEVVEHTVGAKNIVITGGEPFVQNHTLLYEFCAMAKHLGYHVAWETNGTIIPSPDFYDVTDLFTISPKLYSSGQIPFQSSWVDEWVYAFSDLVQFKFVIANEKDAQEAIFIITESQAMKEFRIPIVFQPEESVDAEVYPKLPEMIYDAFRKRRFSPLAFNLRFIPQVHKKYKLR